MVIMVAAHQHAVQAGMPRAPLPQQPDGRRCLGLAGVQQIPQHNQPCCGAGIDQAGESIKRGGRRPPRHRHAECSEGLGLAEVNIGHEKRACLGPPYRATGEQSQRNASHDKREAGGVSRGTRVARGS
jgi:hypothetical protein